MEIIHIKVLKESSMFDPGRGGGGGGRDLYFGKDALSVRHVTMGHKKIEQIFKRGAKKIKTIQK